MSVQGRFDSEGLTAEIAFVWFFASVYSNVSAGVKRGGGGTFLEERPEEVWKGEKEGVEEAVNQVLRRGEKEDVEGKQGRILGIRCA